MGEPLHSIVLVIALVLMLIGVLGTVLPVIPGPIVILLAALGYAVLDRFEAVGWPTLAVLGLLTVLAAVADWLASSLGARKGGASGWSVVIGIVGGLVGLVVLGLPGGILGAVLGVLASELIRLGDWRRALRAGGGWLVGWALSAVLRLGLCLTMVAIFVWQVILGPT